jgi:uncharacterized protein DUF2752
MAKAELKRWVLAAIVTFAVATATLLYYFDPNQCPYYPTCLFHQTTGLLCPGCGSLRALHQLLHGHVLAALRFNPLLVLGLLPLGWFAGSVLIRNAHARSSAVLPSTRWLWVCLVLALAFSVWRNIPGTLFATLPQ